MGLIWISDRISGMRGSLVCGRGAQLGGLLWVFGFVILEFVHSFIPSRGVTRIVGGSCRVLTQRVWWKNVDVASALTQLTGCGF